MPAAVEPIVPGWLTPATQQLVGQLLHSHAQAFGRPLLAGLGADATPLQWSQALFAAATVVLAHDGADPGGDPGPRLIYANRAALRLWRRPWDALVGMPSRLTAEPAERAGRAQALASVQRQHAISDYAGVRIDSQGRRFQIRGARVWTLPCGQAAAFSDWHWL
ncbi:MAG: MEKHLA domain-containing protein [Cyanobium sp. M30B3]|nr:MAG: MEKHLA domain-containing protein [Cyanobium sp. M30B3]